MKNRIRYSLGSLLIAALFLFVGARLWEPLAPAVGLVTKVVRFVDHKAQEADWQKAKVGQPLSNGDQIKTGERSIAIVKFADNNVLRVREESVLKIFAQKNEAGAFSKNVEMTKGTSGFDVKNRENEQFTFTSPTSVASIRGSTGSYTTETEADTLTMLTGTGDLTSNLTGDTETVDGGQTGTVDSQTGDIEVHDSSQDELNNAQGANTDPNINELRMRTSDGRTLIIEFDDQRP